MDWAAGLAEAWIRLLTWLVRGEEEMGRATRKHQGNRLRSALVSSLNWMSRRVG